MLLSSSYGAASALLQATQKEIKTMRHHPEGLLTCEGSCSSEAITPTMHTLLHEIKSKDEHGEIQFKQMYECTCCKTPRQFGLTTARSTVKGVTN